MGSHPPGAPSGLLAVRRALAAGPRRLAPLALLVLVVALGCRFERRPDLEASPDTAGIADTTAQPVVPGQAIHDSLRVVVAAYHEALRVGDVSRVASLTVPGSVLVDQEEGVEWRRGEGGSEVLPQPLDPARTGFGWTRAGSEIQVFEETALLVDQYRVTVSGEEVPWNAVESFLLVRTPDGWRIRFSHRSRGTGPMLAAPPDGRP